METMVPGRMTRAGLLLLPLLLCFVPETTGNIDEKRLRDIVDHVDRYGVAEQYAFAVSLNRTYCQNTAGLKRELPAHKLQQMRNALNQMGGLYDPADGHIVAATVNRLESGAGQHAEWRLLQGGQNSPVQKLLARTSGQNSCLIFFSLNSPCVGTCLAENGPYSILQMVSDTFHPIDDDYKAFVFRQIYWQDQNQWQAWHQLRNVPLYRCKNRCWNCHEENPNCLDRN
ncbi:uncharacterized protein LOC135976267 [Chrysemys picta bellii]|uniref:uncharacterized protein LOC135976267 n=1 Tax=Chrysemys picta bellii TaxID=8478 RepID=UPI0032B20CB2